jgi:hypothetical protein
MTRLNRRGFLFLAALLAPAARLWGFVQQSPASAISAEAFLRLSERLVGKQNLDAKVAEIYRSALVAVPANVPLLARLATATPQDIARSQELRALERAIVESWYTGTYTVNGERRLATHTGALMWSALGMAAPGFCASAFGAWARPPQAKTNG